MPRLQLLNFWPCHNNKKKEWRERGKQGKRGGKGFSSVQFSHSVMSDSVTAWTAACQASLSITNSQSLLKLISIESVMPSNHLIPCHPLLFLLWNFPSIRGFSSESILCIRWPKYWSFIFSISPSNEYWLISFRIDWFDHKYHKGHWYIKINEVLKKETKALDVNKAL